MPRRKGTSQSRYKTATQAAANMHTQDLEVTARLKAEREQGLSVSLNKIQQRQQDTRPLNPLHIEKLKESIVTLGLLEPLVVDQKNTLLAGAHRLRAISKIKIDNPVRFQELFPGDLIPVRVMGFEAKKNPNKALEVEVAENEHRRDYSPQEVRELANRLIEQGYVYRKGKPAKGEKPLGPALEVIIGKHRRTVRRYLEDLNRTSALFKDAGDAKTATLPTLKDQFYRLARLGKRSPAWDNPKKQREIKSLITKLERLFET